jgi:hypothetical protein
MGSKKYPLFLKYKAKIHSISKDLFTNNAKKKQKANLTTNKINGGTRTCRITAVQKVKSNTKEKTHMLHIPHMTHIAHIAHVWFCTFANYQKSTAQKSK